MGRQRNEKINRYKNLFLKLLQDRPLPDDEERIRAVERNKIFNSLSDEEKHDLSIWVSGKLKEYNEKILRQNTSDTRKS